MTWNFFKEDESKIFRVYELSNRESFEVKEELRLWEFDVLTNYMGVLTNCCDKVVILKKDIFSNTPLRPRQCLISDSINSTWDCAISHSNPYHILLFWIFRYASNTDALPICLLRVFFDGFVTTGRLFFDESDIINHLFFDGFCYWPFPSTDLHNFNVHFASSESDTLGAFWSLPGWNLN